MNDNETNAPTIKLPVRYFPPFSEIQDADGEGILRVNGAGQETRDRIEPSIVAALNEADALRSMLEDADTISGMLFSGDTFQLGKTITGTWQATTNARWHDQSIGHQTAAEAYAAIKPNAAEEKQDGE